MSTTPAATVELIEMRELGDPADERLCGCRAHS